MLQRLNNFDIIFQGFIKQRTNTNNFLSPKFHHSTLEHIEVQNKQMHVQEKGANLQKKSILVCCRFFGTYTERVLELWISLDGAGQLSRLPLHSTLLKEN
jgi:hypothetical protein